MTDELTEAVALKKLSIELLGLVERRQVGSIAESEEDIPRVIRLAHRTNADIAQFVGENWPVIVSALRRCAEDTTHVDAASLWDIKGLLEDVEAFISSQIGSSYSETDKEDGYLLDRVRFTIKGIS